MSTITRNAILMDNEDLIRHIARRNRPLFYALRMDFDDAYQELAMAALQAIDTFDPDRAENIRAHIWMELQYAVLNMKKDRHCGRDLPGRTAVMAEFPEERGCAYRANPRDDSVELSPRLRQALSQLDEPERAAVIRYLEDQRPQKTAVFRSALGKLKCYYMTVMPERSVAVCVGEVR